MRSGQELRDTFNTYFSNINSGIAPGINDYEISLFLTKAQYDILDEYYKGSPIKGLTFEDSERVRKILSNTTKHSSVNPSLSSTPSTTKFKCYTVPLDPNCWRVVWERVQFAGGDVCTNGKEVIVKPLTHDEFDTSIENPHKRPSNSKVLRLDLNGAHELVSANSIGKYSYRFMDHPKPIIISNLEDLEDEIGYIPSIQGVTNESLCKHDYFIEEIILNRAVELATVDYKENSINALIPMNNRQE